MTSRSNVLHDRERPPPSDTSTETGAVFPQCLLESAGSEFVPIVHLYKMSKMESGSLTRARNTNRTL